MDDIRKHFESQITEEMRRKDREQRENERNLRREEQRRQWQREQRKARDEEKRRREAKEERRRQQLKEDREKRKIEARREAERLYRDRLERYSQEQRLFEAECLSEWKTMLEVQLHQRAEFQAQQRLQVQQELTRLSRKKLSLKKVLHPIPTVQLHRELKKKLRHFENEVMKPIDEQIADAVRFATGKLDLKTSKKLDQLCGWRLNADQRIKALLSLNQIPDEPEKFFSKTLKPPAKPTASFSLASSDLDIKYWAKAQDSHRHGVSDVYAERPANDRHASRVGSRQTWKRSTTVTSNSDVETDDSGAGLELSDNEIDPTDEEWALGQREVSFERLGACEIEQRDKITRLQDDFRRLDRSALASMAKGKKGFRRDSELIALLQHSRNCAASDPRDRVYAFIGLAEPGYNIIPNYRSVNKLEQVLIETAKCIIHHDQSLAILQHVYRGRAKLGVRLPSWVPDWTSKETSYGIDKHEWKSTKPFDAGKGSRAIAEFHHHSEDGFYEDLKVRGVFVGKIENIEIDSELEHVSSLILSEGEWVFGPKAARFDDEVWVLYGSTRPAVLRPEGGGRFGYLGDALVCEDVANTEQTMFTPIMYGQMIDRVQEGTALVKDIWII